MTVSGMLAAIMWIWYWHRYGFCTTVRTRMQREVTPVELVNMMDILNEPAPAPPPAAHIRPDAHPNRHSMPAAFLTAHGIDDDSSDSGPDVHPNRHSMPATFLTTHGIDDDASGGVAAGSSPEAGSSTPAVPRAPESAAGHVTSEEEQEARPQ